MQDTLSVVAFVSMVAGIVGLFYTDAFVASAPIAIGVQALAVLLMIWARFTFGRRSFHAAATPTSGGIVRTGPYRYLRHPIYTAAILFVWPPAIAHGGAIPLASAAVISAGKRTRWAMSGPP